MDHAQERWFDGLPEGIAKAEQVHPQAVVGLFGATIGEVLIMIGQFIIAFFTKTEAYTELRAELESRGQILVPDFSVAEQVSAETDLRKRRDTTG